MKTGGRLAQIKKQFQKIFGIPCQVCKKEYATVRTGGCRTVYLCKNCEKAYQNEQKE